MPIELSDNEIETVRALSIDWAWDYNISAGGCMEAPPRKVAALARRLKLDNIALDFES
jgi:hypothetical protein